MDNILDGAVSLGQDVIVLGDLNADFSAKRESSRECKQLKAFFKTLQFKQLIKEPTRIASNASTLIDLIATNNPQNIRDSGVISASLSDHEMIYCVQKLNWKKAPAQMKAFRNYVNYYPVKLCEDRKGVDLSHGSHRPSKVFTSSYWEKEVLEKMILVLEKCLIFSQKCLYEPCKPYARSIRPWRRP